MDEESTTERKDSRLRRKITDRLFDRAEEVVQHLSKYDKKGTGALSPEKFRKGLQRSFLLSLSLSLSFVVISVLLAVPIHILTPVVVVPA